MNKNQVWKKILGLGTCDFCGKSALYEIQKGRGEDCPETYYYRVSAKTDVKLCKDCFAEFEVELGNIREFRKSKFSSSFNVRSLGKTKYQ